MMEWLMAIPDVNLEIYRCDWKPRKVNTSVVYWKYVCFALGNVLETKVFESLPATCVPCNELYFLCEAEWEVSGYEQIYSKYL